ncbi:MAG: tetratricopeptide repeat protein [Kiritimatiellae bacterium]|nr:tetratricopeptide repeat protein [Kiritimatiellia bacterium]
MKKRDGAALASAAAIVVLGVLGYSNTLRAEFHFDDRPSIVENPGIRSLRNVTRLSKAYPSRFIGYLTFALNYRYGGLDVRGYHAVNLLIHIVNGLLVWRLVRQFLRVTGPPPAGDSNGTVASAGDPRLQAGLALFAGLLFVAHPVQTQAVTYVIQRVTSLAALFYLLAMTLYMDAAAARARLNARFFACTALALLATLLAMFTKEAAFTLPIALVLLELCFLRSSAAARRKRIFFLLPFLLTLLVIPLTGLISARMPIGLAAEHRFISPWQYLFTQFNVVRTYLRLLFVPIGQNLDYDYPTAESLLELPTVLSMLLVLALLAFGLAAVKRNALVGFGILFFFLALAVESTVIPLRDVIFEHRLYLPLFGAVTAFAGGAAPWLARPAGGRLPTRRRACAAALGLLLVVAAGAGAYLRNRVWKDEVSLWTDAVTKSPAKPRPHYNLGVALMKAGETEQARYQYSKALALRPDYAEAHVNLGSSFALEQKYDRAMYHYSRALRVDPYYPDGHNSLGAILYQRGQTERAIQHFSKAIRANFYFPDAHYNLGVALAAAGRAEQALSHYYAVLRLDPTNVHAHSGAGQCLTQLGKLDGAMWHYSEALRIKPDFANARNNLGAAFAQQGKTAEAKREYSEALRVDPNFADAHNNLAIVLAQTGEPNAARYHYSEALRIHPRFAKAHNNLGALFANQKAYDAAIAHFREALRIDPAYASARLSLSKALQLKKEREEKAGGTGDAE